MRKLLKKNLLLNKKNIIIGILIAFFFSSISIDGNRYYSVALMMCPALLFNSVVGKMCYMEDSLSTQQFLLSLPISIRDIVLEKNILSYICIVVGIGIANIGSIIINLIKFGTVYFEVNINIIIAMALIVYNTVYISLNYKFDYSKTRFTPYILLVFMFILFKFGSEIVGVISSGKTVILLCTGIIIIVANYMILNYIAADYGRKR